MQCGSIRHTAVRPDNAPASQMVIPRWLPPPEISSDDSIQSLFTQLIQSEYRNRIIVQDILLAYSEGRKILVLTERTDHLGRLHTELDQSLENVFVLHGRLPKKTRDAVLSELYALDDHAPRILLATGKLVGEGFDYPPLDTLILAMPISWKGILQQYAGRLHRNHPTKTDVRIYDYVELSHSLLARMWEKRFAVTWQWDMRSMARCLMIQLPLSGNRRNDRFMGLEKHPHHLDMERKIG